MPDLEVVLGGDKHDQQLREINVDDLSSKTNEYQ
jgi:hypothetical protein